MHGDVSKALERVARGIEAYLMRQDPRLAYRSEASRHRLGDAVKSVCDEGQCLLADLRRCKTKEYVLEGHPSNIVITAAVEVAIDAKVCDTRGKRKILQGSYVVSTTFGGLTVEYFDIPENESKGWANRNR